MTSEATHRCHALLFHIGAPIPQRFGRNQLFLTGNHISYVHTCICELRDCFILEWDFCRIFCRRGGPLFCLGNCCRRNSCRYADCEHTCSEGKTYNAAEKNPVWLAFHTSIPGTFTAPFSSRSRELAPSSLQKPHLSGKTEDKLSSFVCVWVWGSCSSITVYL